MDYDEGKWQKHNCLSEDKYLYKKIPKTEKLNYTSFSEFLAEFDKVILKPIFGSFGKGIIVVNTANNNLIYLQMENRLKRFYTPAQAYKYISGFTKTKSYIIQQYISFATYKKTIFDIRIMVQKKLACSWDVTGRLAKIGQMGFVVTNPEEEVLPVKKVLKKSDNLLKYDSEYLLKEMDELSILAAKQLAKWYPDINTIGFDLALDKDGKVWIIEANFTPSLNWFKDLPDNNKTYIKLMNYKKISNKKVNNQERCIDEYYYYH